MSIDINNLPPKQREVLEAICDMMQTQGYPPSIHQLCERCGVSSSATIHYHLTALKKKGFIHWNEKERRAITLHPSLETNTNEAPSRKLPILGSIAAGSPLLQAPGQGTQEIDLAEALYKKDAYLLKVRGESMIEDHIDDGDLVLVDPKATIRNGDVVVALVDGNETTLKHIDHKDGLVHLIPANSTMAPIIKQPEQVEIQGKVLAVIRQLA